MLQANIPRGIAGLAPSGRLTVDGLDAVELATEYGTPLFVFSAGRIRENYRRLSASLRAVYPHSRVMYACKANGLVALLRIMREEGAGIDVVSEGEFYLARQAGFHYEDIVFNGNSKTDAEILLAASNDVILNVDSLDELRAISSCATGLGRVARVCLRVVPNVHSRTISEFATGIPESKFGLDIRSGEAWEAAREALRHPQVELVGLHCHIGSQIEVTEPYELAVRSVLEFAADLRRELDAELGLINLGGGYGVRFAGSQAVPSLEQFARAVAGTFKSTQEALGLRNVFLMVEPGASLVADAGVVMLTVTAVKKRRDGPTWVAVDGGADILLRATQGWYTFPVISADDPLGEASMKAHIAGPLCYSGDVLAHDVELPPVRRGSRLAVLEAGAYTLCLLNHYNGRLGPAVVLVADGRSRLVERRGRPEDLVAREMVPSGSGIDGRD